ncbi:MAG: YaiI/YqxD family protein [Alphaproteobacteria bacterium]|nr:YaiI/YqxD family protein [Alphaproteobacteria bacterium]
MRIWIDADACPVAVREIVFRASRKRQLPVTLVANKPLQTPSLRWITSEVVSGALDAADDRIVERLEPGDLVITQDLPLAADVVAKGGTAISPRGETFTEANIRERLSMRDTLTEARAMGMTTGGPPPFDDKVKRAFAAAFDRWLAAAGKAS